MNGETMTVERQVQGLTAEMIGPIKSAMTRISEDVLETSNQLCQDAQALIVLDLGTAERAAALRKMIGLARKKLAERLGPIKRAVDALKREPLDAERKLDQPMREADELLGRRITAWQQVEREKMIAEQRRLESVAKKEQEDRALEVAAESEQEGDSELAQAIIDETVAQPPPVIPIEMPKIAGTATRVYWYAEIVALKTYLSAIVAGDVPLMGALGIEQVENKPGCYESSFLIKQAAIMKTELKFPGVRTWSEEKSIKGR